MEYGVYGDLIIAVSVMAAKTPLGKEYSLDPFWKLTEPFIPRSPPPLRLHIILSSIPKRPYTLGGGGMC